MPFVKLAFEKRNIASGETPEALFEHLQGPYAFLLKAGDEGRYSYLGADPFLISSSRDGLTRLQKRRDFFEWKRSLVEQLMEGDPLDILRDLFKKVAYKEKSPVPFFGGACGYFSYDFGTGFENVQQKVFDDIQIPDYVFSFFDKIVAFDHHSGEVFFLGLGETDFLAKKKVEELQNDLQKPVSLVSAGQIGDLQSNLSFNQYQDKIIEIQKLLRKGETYQVNFSQRFSADCTLDSWKIFKRLSFANPASFSCYFDYGDFQIISASPELLLRKRGLKLETWPIKGTIVRGKEENEDEIQIENLLASEKDKAELSMIVDLERNDFGKVCEAGTVTVESHREIQKLAHVFHTFSRVSGKLPMNKDFFDAFRAVFPGGSITGCPKKRTMEIIDRLEDFRRGVYTGSAGFINFSGDADFNILIRTLLRKDDRVYFQAGGGIVMDSDQEAEYEESLAKARAMREAVLIGNKE